MRGSRIQGTTRPPGRVLHDFVLVLPIGLCSAINEGGGIFEAKSFRFSRGFEWQGETDCPFVEAEYSALRICLPALQQLDLGLCGRSDFVPEAAPVNILSHIGGTLAAAETECVCDLH